MARLTRIAGQCAYAGLFVVVWPGLLAYCAIRLDASEFPFWPQPFPMAFGVFLAAIGMSVVATSMWALWHKGNGLPMNAFPPPRFVATSTYALFSHPIYVGFTVLVVGVSVLCNSAAGLWFVVPLSAAACAALVLGYEGPDLRRRFGPQVARPLFALPAAGADVPSLQARLHACVIAFGPWVLIYAVLSLLPAPAGAFEELRMPWEFRVPHPYWAIWVYSMAYIMAPASVLLASSNDLLRRYVRSAWAGTAIGFLVMLTMPAKAALLSLDTQGVSMWLTHINRLVDADWLALPSFHVFWVVLAALALNSRGRLYGCVGATFAAGVASSCVLSGSHALVDVAGGCVLAFLCWYLEAVWHFIVQAGSRLSNSWSAMRIGPVRIISHFIWSFAGAAFGTAVVLYFGGPAILVPSIVVIATGLLCAGAWGYWLEGGTRLSRPFGYYGYLLGSLTMLVVLFWMGVAGTGALVAAFATAAPVAQALGRLRCIVQGCCHGRTTTTVEGFQVTHACSRVTALSGLHGVRIHPTPLYSIVGNLVLVLLLVRLWRMGATWPIISGTYLVLSSLARFVEEQYRGEPQTPSRFGMTMYQWLAVLMFLVGLGVLCVSGATATSAQWISWQTVAVSVGMGLVAGFLMSVDFPDSQRRFSHLTVFELTPPGV
jgi:Prolipoprotein diacylglyceryl transferase/PAP2 superfamily/Phospholipid methyltransferase